MGICLRNVFFFSLIIAICFVLQSCSASISPKQQLQHFRATVVEGSVYCNTCFQQDFSKFGHFMPGALVAVKCEGIGKNKLRFQKKVKTNEHGVFRFRLPLELSRNLEAIKICSVKLVRSGQSFCSMASSSSSETSSGFRLKSRRHGVRGLSAGFFTFKPLKRPESCYLESRFSTTEKYSLLSRKRVRPALFFPPPIPFLPSPPNVGGIPLPPSPLQPPPSILPPLPFQPPPPPFISIPPLPNIPPLPSIPPFPYLAPPPPPPPAVMFPPLPFPPIFPGNPPPAASSRRAIP